ncbi:hypothetical protein BTJ39_03345 [Izhakiella australiensis]|uniref:Uncharacterized protein n=1 Tax=Izhakiella australiensis TaxID=1926881 RepID=A0A1S8YQG5_9GAMM|nr:glycosyltransferase [Izhakiella australiensis]OON41017.1 hypothetical protein BTJ39_03345 [Izhakiella australiensis]
MNNTHNEDHLTKSEKFNIHMIYHGNINKNTILNIFNTANNNKNNNVILWLDEEAKKSCACLEQIAPSLKIRDSRELREIKSTEEGDAFSNIRRIYSEIDEIQDGKEKGKCFSDLGRLVAVYNYGGLYLDTDVIVNEELSKNNFFSDCDFKTHLSVSNSKVETDFYDAFGIKNACDNDLGEVLKELCSDYRDGYVDAKKCGDLVRIRELIQLKLKDTLDEDKILDIISTEIIDEDTINMIEHISISGGMNNDIEFTDMNESIRAPSEYLINTYNEAIKENIKNQKISIVSAERKITGETNDNNIVHLTDRSANLKINQTDSKRPQETSHGSSGSIDEYGPPQAAKASKNKYSHTFFIPTEPPSEQLARSLTAENCSLIYYVSSDMLSLLSLPPEAALEKLMKTNEIGYEFLSKLSFDIKTPDGIKINEAFLHFMIGLVDDIRSPAHLKDMALVLRSPNKQGSTFEQFVRSIFSSKKEGYYDRILREKALAPLLKKLVDKLIHESVTVYGSESNPVTELLNKIRKKMPEAPLLSEPYSLGRDDIKEIMQAMSNKSWNAAKEIALEKHRKEEIRKKQKKIFKEINNKLIKYNLLVPSYMENHVFPAHLFKVDSVKEVSVSNMINLMKENGLYILNISEDKRETEVTIKKALKTDKAGRIISESIEKSKIFGQIDKDKAIKIAREKLTEHILTDPFFIKKINEITECFTNLEKLRSEEIARPDDMPLINEDAKKQIDKVLVTKIEDQAQKDIQKALQEQAEKDITEKATEEIRAQAEKDITEKATEEIRAQAGKVITEKATEEIRAQAGKVIAEKATEEIRAQAGKVIAEKATEEIRVQARKEIDKKTTEIVTEIISPHVMQKLDEITKVVEGLHFADLVEEIEALEVPKHEPAQSSSSKKRGVKVRNRERIAEGIDDKGRPFFGNGSD